MEKLSKLKVKDILTRNIDAKLLAAVNCGRKATAKAGKGGGYI